MEKIFEARTEKEAIEQAVRAFGVNEDYIEVQVLNKQKKGLWGLQKKVTINASVIGLPSTDVENEFDESQDADSENNFTKRDSSNRRFDSENRSNTDFGDRSTISHTREEQAPPELIPRKKLTEHQKKEFASIVELLTSKMDIEVDIDYFDHDEQVFADIHIQTESDQNLLIGKYGKNLDALQLITNTMLQHKYDEPLEKIILEIENYRSKRNDWLRSLAHKKADQVQQSGQSYTLEELNPYDRKVVHSTIRDISGVSTESKGHGYYKRIEIYNSV